MTHDPLVVDVLRDVRTWRDPEVIGRYVRCGVVYDFTEEELDAATALMLDQLEAFTAKWGR